MATVCDYCDTTIEGEKCTGTLPLVTNPTNGERLPEGYVEGADFHPECAVLFRQEAKKVKGKRPPPLPPRAQEATP